MEANSWKSITASLNLTKWGITTSFAAERMRGFRYVPPDSGSSVRGWVERDEEQRLLPSTFKLAFAKSTSMQGLWNNRLKFSFNTSASLNLNLQRYTNSNFLFSLGFTLGINNFLDLSFSANSENAYIYRYMKDLPFFRDADIYIPEGPQNNLFLDLVNSFRFDDESLRRSSGFKMKGFSIGATHHLGDWTAKLDWSMVPERASGSNQYEINNKVSFSVRWIPINEIKSEITYNQNTEPTWIVK
jgi:hypothetical protein